MEDKKQDDMFYLLLIGLAVFAAWAAWTFFRLPILWVIFSLDWVQLKILEHTIGLTQELANHLVFITAIFDGRINADTVLWEEVAIVSNTIGTYFRIPTSLLIMAAVITVVFRMRGQGLKRRFTLTGQSQQSVIFFAGIEIKSKLLKSIVTFGSEWKNPILRLIMTILLIRPIQKKLVKGRKEWRPDGMSFMRYQAQEWPVILPGVHFQPDLNDPKEGPQLNPLEWCRDNKVGLTDEKGLDEDAAETAFARQLGTQWQGIEKAPLYAQAIAVMCGLNVKRESKELRALTGKLSMAFTVHREKSQEMVTQLISKYMNDKKFVEVLNKYGNQHAYLNTAMIRILLWGREKGDALPSSWFRWVKPLDRDLWYALNNVGRRKFHIEGAGTQSHFHCERILGEPIIEANVDAAIDGLNFYLNEQGVTDLETFFRVDKDF